MAKPQFDVHVNGVGLATQGLTDRNTTDPLSLLVYGLVWTCGNNWGPALMSNVTLTSWSTYAGFTITTAWTTYSGFTVTTTWTDYEPSGVEEC